MQSRSEDTLGAVLENYRNWKGEPTHLHRSDDQEPQLSSQFAILEYATKDNYSVYCTLGASYQQIPTSQTMFNDPRGVRYEYLMHSLPQYQNRICDVLLMVAVYPFLQNIFLSPGSIIPLGTGETIIEDSSIDYVYLTYPYLDDHRIYTPPCWGEIDISSMLIQTLWVIPVYRSEALYIWNTGADKFDQLCYKSNLQAHDFHRAPLV